MTEERAIVGSGGCQCGAQRYAFYAKPEGIHLCHCRLCQRAMGGIFAPLAPIRLKDFAWTKGAPATFNSSERAERGYCRDCGTPLFFRYLAGQWIDVTLGSLDDPNAFAPELNYGAESIVCWYDRIVHLPRKQTEPGGLTGKAEP